MGRLLSITILTQWLIRIAMPLIRGFMTDSSEMNVQVEVELPMYGTASGFEARDTFGINFDSYQEFDDVEFKVVSENGIPFGCGLPDLSLLMKMGWCWIRFLPHSEIFWKLLLSDDDGIPIAVAEKTTFTNFEGSNDLTIIKSAKLLFLSGCFFYCK